MSHDTNAPDTTTHRPYVELQVGIPYARLITYQQLFARAVAQCFSIDPYCVLPTAGATGAIEAIRNHTYKASQRATPLALIPSPEYWSARESLQGFGFTIHVFDTHMDDFFLNEQKFVKRAAEEQPDLLYLSLPNNPTGAIFEPEAVISSIPEQTTILIDMTLPSETFNAAAMVKKLFERFTGRKNCFLVGSTSKSHGTAEYRIGWAICMCLEDARLLRQEGRNAVSSIAIREGIKHIDSTPTAFKTISQSFALLKEGEKQGRFSIVRPARMVETSYVLVKNRISVQMLRKTLVEKKIHVMWGSTLGLSDQYIRLEILEPANVHMFVDIINTIPIL